MGIIAIFFVLSSCVVSHSMWNDLNNYEISYNGMNSFPEITLSNDWGFYALMYCLKSFELSFMEAKAVLMLLCLLLLYCGVEQYSENVVIFVLFFWSFCMSFQTTQILRNSIGFLVAFQGISVLLDDPKRRRILKFVLWILVGAQFHSSIYLFLPLVFVLVKPSFIKKYRKIIILTIFMIVISMIFLIRSGVLISGLAAVIGNILGSGKYVSYAIAKSRYGWLAVAVIWISIVVSTIYFTKRINYSGQLKETKLKAIHFTNGKLSRKIYYKNYNYYANHIMMLILVASIYVPMAIFSLHLYRYVHYLTIFYFIYMGLIYDTAKNNKSIKYQVLLHTGIIASFWLVFEIFIYSGTLGLESLSDYVVNGQWFWR